LIGCGGLLAFALSLPGLHTLLVSLIAFALPVKRQALLFCHVGGFGVEGGVLQGGFPRFFHLLAQKIVLYPLQQSLLFFLPAQRFGFGFGLGADFCRLAFFFLLAAASGSQRQPGGSGNGGQGCGTPEEIVGLKIGGLKIVRLKIVRLKIVGLEIGGLEGGNNRRASRGSVQ
jgi:hypothetical protein